MSSPQDLIKKTAEYVEQYMSKFDGSHDYNHIKRVLSLSHHLYSLLPTTSHSSASLSHPNLDLNVITLSALLHDVGDKKYLKQGQNEQTMVYDLLLNLGAEEELARKVQVICLGVSYSTEIQDFQLVQNLIKEHPELAIVQDADRLDSIGAVGIARLFTYGGAKTTEGMQNTIKIMEIKLLKLESMMKTEPGRKLAKERTERLIIFREQWNEEAGIAESASSILKNASF